MPTGSDAMPIPSLALPANGQRGASKTPARTACPPLSGHAAIRRSSLGQFLQPEAPLKAILRAHNTTYPLHEPALTRKADERLARCETRFPRPRPSVQQDYPASSPAPYVAARPSHRSGRQENETDLFANQPLCCPFEQQESLTMTNRRRDYVVEYESGVYVDLVNVAFGLR